MAHPARCFLLCSCMPLSETLREIGGVSSQTMPISPGEQGANGNNQPCTDGSPSPCTSFSFALTLPPAVCPLPQVHSPLTASFSWFATPNLVFCCCCLLIQRVAFAPLQNAREINYYNTAPHHLPLNLASHLLILLLMMSICSLSVKQLLTCVIHSIDLIFLVLFIPFGAY